MTQNVFALAIGVVYSRDELRQWLNNNGANVDTGLAGFAGLRARQRAKHAADDIITKWIAQHALEKVDGGYRRPIPAARQTFLADIGDGRGPQPYSCAQTEVDTLLAELREKRAAHDPLARRMAALEAELQDMKEGTR